jgi:predicted HD superfamily hydrolase involved in NAD metabolism
LDHESIIEEIRRKLKPKRFFHCLGAFECATVLALRFGANADKAGTAALLHDCGREYPHETQWRLIVEWNTPVAPNAHDYPSLWHSWLAPEIARRQYGLDDPEIESAVRYHSTGKPDMTPLEAISFLADFIEPTRDFPGLEDLRAIARQDLWLAVKACLESTQEHLKERGLLMHPDGVAALQFYGG